MISKLHGYSGFLPLYPDTPRSVGIRQGKIPRVVGGCGQCSPQSPDTYAVITPNHWGVPVTTLWARTFTPLMWKRGQGRLNLFSSPRTYCHGNQRLPPQRLGQFSYPLRTRALVSKTGLTSLGVPSLSDSCTSPTIGVLHPLRTQRTLPGWVARTGGRIDCSTVRCSPVESRTCPSFLFRDLLCSSLPLAPSAGGAPSSFILLFSVRGTSGQKPQSEQSRLCLSWGIPLLMCLVSSVTALKTHIFAYFAYFTNRECWLLITILFWCESGCL